MSYPQFQCKPKVTKIGYCFMQLGMSLVDLLDFIMTGLDLKKNVNSGQGASNANPNLGV